MRGRGRRRRCAICGLLFHGHLRLGKRQKTCGQQTCRREWHRRQCTSWNKTHQHYFREIYLAKRIERFKRPATAPPLPFRPTHSAKGLFPWKGFQEVISPQLAVILDYFFHTMCVAVRSQVEESLGESTAVPGQAAEGLLVPSGVETVQEVIVAQSTVIKGVSGDLVLTRFQEVITGQTVVNEAVFGR